MSNVDGDVYVESAGDDSEIVLRTQKVRIDGDVYCGSSSSSAGLSSRIDALQPPKCLRPGGDKLQFDGTSWTCVCVGAYGGTTCETTWSAEARIVNKTEDNGYSYSNSQSGHRVAAYGDEILIGNGGSMRLPMILKRSPSTGTWDAVWNLSASYVWIDGTRDYTNLGASVSLSGDRAILGAPEVLSSNINSPGFAMIFERLAGSTATWSFITKLVADDLDSSSYSSQHAFGYDVAISGEYAMVSTGRSNSPASVYIFERDSTTTSWPQKAKLSSPVSSATNDNYGASIALDGNYAVVGASYDADLGDYSGAAYIYGRSASGTWEQVIKLTAYDGTLHDYFGYSVSLSGNYALIGCYGDDESGSSSGSAYVYVRSIATGEWMLDAKLTASNGAANDQFGYSVAISGSRAFVGASNKASSFGQSGVAYLFEREQQSGTWKETAKLTDFEGSYNQFAAHVAISSAYAIGASQLTDYMSNNGHVYVIANFTHVAL